VKHGMMYYELKYPLHFCHPFRKVRETLPSFRQFFSSAFSLTHISLASMKMPPDVLRWARSAICLFMLQF